MSLSKTVFPGGALIGDDAGFLNVSRIKGSHVAIKTGMLAADAAFNAVQADRQSDGLNAYPDAFKQSWLYTELYRVVRTSGTRSDDRELTGFLAPIQEPSVFHGGTRFASARAPARPRWCSFRASAG